MIPMGAALDMFNRITEELYKFPQNRIYYHLNQVELMRKERDE